MQIITPNNGAVIVEGDVTLDAMKVAPRWAEADGYYAVSSRTGLVTGVAAGATIWSVRWPHPTKLMVVDLLRVRSVVTTPPTAAQEWGMDAVVARVFTDSGATGTSPPIAGAGGFKKRATYPLSAMIGASASPRAWFQVATTTSVGGTFVADQSPFIDDCAWELAAGVAVPRSRIFLEKDYADAGDAPIQLRQDEGILVRSVTLLGAAMVIRVSVEFAWHEVDPCDV